VSGAATCCLFGVGSAESARRQGHLTGHRMLHNNSTVAGERAGCPCAAAPRACEGTATHTHSVNGNCMCTRRKTYSHCSAIHVALKRGGAPLRRRGRAQARRRQQRLRHVSAAAAGRLPEQAALATTTGAALRRVLLRPCGGYSCGCRAASRTRASGATRAAPSCPPRRPCTCLRRVERGRVGGGGRETSASVSRGGAAPRARRRDGVLSAGHSPDPPARLPQSMYAPTMASSFLSSADLAAANALVSVERSLAISFCTAAAGGSGWAGGEMRRRHPRRRPPLARATRGHATPRTLSSLSSSALKYACSAARSLFCRSGAGRVNGQTRS
jgi:hypothetical protein